MGTRAKCITKDVLCVNSMIFSFVFVRFGGLIIKSFPNQFECRKSNHYLEINKCECVSSMTLKTFVWRKYFTQVPDYRRPKHQMQHTFLYRMPNAWYRIVVCRVAHMRSCVYTFYELISNYLSSRSIY